jgi:diguanylate cyclase (GGDEF)-like protein
MTSLDDSAGPLDPLAVQLVAALGESELAVALYDGQDRLRWANAAFARRFLDGVSLPISFADLLRHDAAHGFGVKIDSGDVEAFLAQVHSRRRSAPFRSFEADLIGGEWLWMTETLTASGWLVSIASVITPLKQSERTLRQARDHAMQVAQTDPLTGAPNRRSVLERAADLLESAHGDGRTLSLIAVDLDHFKQINDQYGHDAGDDVLRHFVRHCCSELRQSDHFGRLGGEEFLLVLPSTSRADAVRASERVRQRLSPALWRARPLSYTFSAGVAQADLGESLGDVLRRADRALYAAKNSGRNCTVEDAGEAL